MTGSPVVDWTVATCAAFGGIVAVVAAWRESGVIWWPLAVLAFCTSTGLLIVAHA